MIRRAPGHLAASCAVLVLAGGSGCREPSAPRADPCATLPFLARYEALGTVQRLPDAVRLELLVDQHREGSADPCGATDLWVVLELAPERGRCLVRRARVWSFENVGCTRASPPDLRRIEAFRLDRPVDLGQPALERIELWQKERALVLLKDRFWWFDHLEPGQTPVLRLQSPTDGPDACCLGETSSRFLGHAGPGED